MREVLKGFRQDPPKGEYLDEQELKAPGDCTCPCTAPWPMAKPVRIPIVDLLAEFDQSRRLTLIGAIGIEKRLSYLPGVPVELTQKGKLEPRAQERAERKAVLVFL